MSKTCPDCGVPMSDEALGGVTLAACPACQAVTIGRDALLRLRGVDRTTHPLLRPSPGEVAPAGGAHEAARACPSCQQTMSSFRYRGGSVRVEQCAHCQLLYLDHGELAKVLNEWEQGIEGGEAAEAALLAHRAGDELGDWLSADSALGLVGVVAVVVVLYLVHYEWASVPVAVVLGVAFYLWQRRKLRRARREAARGMRELADDERRKVQAARGQQSPSRDVDRCPWCETLVKRGTKRCHACDSDIF